MNPPPDTEKPRLTLGVVIAAGCLGIMAALLCASTLFIGGVALYRLWEDVPQSTTWLAAATEVPVPTPTLIKALPTPMKTGEVTEAQTPMPRLKPTASPTSEALPVAPTSAIASQYNLEPPESVEQHPVTSIASETLAQLLELDFPARDYYESAIRLGYQDAGPRTITRATPRIGDRQTFVVNGSSIEAELVTATEHAYFWGDESLSINQAAWEQAARRFEAEYYPSVTSFFGQPWNPGVDGDPHFTILHLGDTNNDSVPGYFISANEYPRTIDPDSNVQEMFYINMSYLEMGEDLYFGTLVHEFQHLVHWYLDSNEETWLDEGLAQLGEIYVGLNTATAQDFLGHPTVQLNSWNFEDDELVYAHYGASYLFSVYFWEQLGSAAVQELIRQPDNGLASVNTVLAGFAPELSLKTFLGNWAIANYLDDPTAGSSYHYERFNLVKPSANTTIRRIPTTINEQVPPIAAQYLQLNLGGEATFSFAGDTLTELVPIRPHSGQYMWLAPGQDNLDASLTAEFDLAGLSTATLNFWAWYDLEENWEFAYVAVSDDAGRSWDLLSPEHSSAGEFGPAFGGRSSGEADHAQGWVKESISLNQYADQKIMIRFELLTDSSIPHRGFAIDDVTIPELNYLGDAETPDIRWFERGFLRTDGHLPQEWSVHLLLPGEPSQVIPFELDSLNQGQITAEMGPRGGVLVIMPVTPFAIEDASYWLTIER